MSRSPADSERWGVSTFRTFPESREDLKAHEDDFVIARIDANRLDLVQYALKIGYLLCDTLAYWKGSTNVLLPVDFSLPSGYQVRDRKTDDQEAVSRIAANAFENYLSHYSADPRTREQTQAVYAHWAGSFTGPGIVIEHNNAPVAFGHFCEPCELILAAVSPVHAGKGLYTHLLAACARWGMDRGVDTITGQDQVTNLAVQKVWVRMGFAPYKHVYTLHRWP